MVCEAMFTVCESRVISHEITHNSKYNNTGLTKWLKILAGDYFPPKLLLNCRAERRSWQHQTEETNMYRGSDKIQQ